MASNGNYNTALLEDLQWVTSTLTWLACFLVGFLSYVKDINLLIDSFTDFHKSICMSGVLEHIQCNRELFKKCQISRNIRYLKKSSMQADKDYVKLT